MCVCVLKHIYSLWLFHVVMVRLFMHPSILSCVLFCMHVFILSFIDYCTAHATYSGMHTCLTFFASGMQRCGSPVLVCAAAALRHVLITAPSMCCQEQLTYNILMCEVFAP